MFCVPDLKILILELRSIDAFSPSAIEVSKIASLHHETIDHSVKDASFEGERFPTHFASSCFSCTQLSEILSCPGYNIFEQLHYHPTLRLSLNFNVEVDPGVTWRGSLAGLH